jgi:uncharacterized protein (DUF433 family)
MDAKFVYKDLLWQDPERMSGALCFYGTRLPVSHMFEHLEAGYTIEKFCEAFDLPLDVPKKVLDLSSKGLENFLVAAA